MKKRKVTPWIGLIAFIAFQIIFRSLYAIYYSPNIYDDDSKLFTVYLLFSSLIIVYSAVFYFVLIHFFGKHRQILHFSVFMLISLVLYVFFSVIRVYSFLPQTFMRFLGATSGILLFVLAIYAFTLILQNKYPKIVYAALFYFLFFHYLLLNFTSRYASGGINLQYYTLLDFKELGILYLILGLVLCGFQGLMIRALYKKEERDKELEEEHKELFKNTVEFDFSKRRNNP